MRIALTGKADPAFADRLSESLDLPLISLEISPDPETGLISDDLFIDLIQDNICSKLNTPGSGASFLLQNYPRNVIQAQALDMALSRIGQPMSTALVLESAKISQNRTNLALIRYYRSQNKLLLIDESAGIEDICKKIYSIYEKRRTRNQFENR